jgi:hypothetical protein
VVAGRIASLTSVGSTAPVDGTDSSVTPGQATNGSTMRAVAGKPGPRLIKSRSCAAGSTRQTQGPATVNSASTATMTSDAIARGLRLSLAQASCQYDNDGRGSACAADAAAAFAKSAGVGSNGTALIAALPAGR